MGFTVAKGNTSRRDPGSGIGQLTARKSRPLLDDVKPTQIAIHRKGYLRSDPGGTRSRMESGKWEWVSRGVWRLLEGERGD